MPSIQTYMTQRHRHCDDSFTAAEEAVSKADWPQAESQWQQFADDLQHHLQQEEALLFPAFEAATGSTAGPTSVMRMEHDQMRAMLSDMTRTLEARNSERFLGLSETLMVLMQQHNMKEEQILYPMTDNALPDAAAVCAQLEAF